AGRHPSSRRSQPARVCLRSAKARLSARPCRQRLRPASGRSLGNPARSFPSVHLPFSPLGPLAFLLSVAPTTCGPACGVQCPHTGALAARPPSSSNTPELGDVTQRYLGTQPSTGPIPKHGANGATGFRRRAVSVQARRESRSSTGQPEELT